MLFYAAATRGAEAGACAFGGVDDAEREVYGLGTRLRIAGEVESDEQHRAATT